ncbi:CBS domain-containing protein [Aquincola sp. S2]|uniref:CBS domain-containing protein n=1 Tax=Pseudaquabacterium terrae TaxID=2732868 RepID=A0ABX2EI10_9BURK|nr:CBS domain-containing protein [Aquabacterium terrae]NRF68216.1 CBS domain-containing protein [Aquabacterium terrae]
MTQVLTVMTRGVRSLKPSDTLVMAAQAMEELDVGVIPVCQDDQLVGVVTDRDIVLRAVAQGRAADKTALSEVMSQDLSCCYEDQTVDEVLTQMRGAQIRRVPVLDRNRHLVGMVTLGDVAVRCHQDSEAGEALEAISQPSAPDRSGQSQASGAAGGGNSTGMPRRGTH